MNRRGALCSIGAMVAACLAAGVHAQSPRRIVVLVYAPADNPQVQGNLRLAREGLAREGFAEGRDFVLEPVHLALGKDLEARADAALRGAPALVIALTTPLAQAAARATREIPVVFGIVSDPVGSGIVASLARPGGNVTGVSNMLPELSGKLLELALELIPATRRVAVLWNPDNPAKRLELEALRDAARARSVELRELPARSEQEIERAIHGLRQTRVDALAILEEALTQANRKRIAGLTAAARVPVISNNHGPTIAGGLASYSPNYDEMGRRVGALAAKILRGARPGDVPVERPTLFGLMVNLKAADALGVRVPHAIRLRADEVIE